MKALNKFLVVNIFVLTLGAGWAPATFAFGGFDDGGGAGLPSCAACHSDLANFGPDHAAHSALSNNDCNSCHVNGAGNNNPPLDNCVRCHGRDADAGGDNVSPGLARGLRQHHQINGTNCGACHADATGLSGVGEQVLPSFYPQALNGQGLDSCDGSEERFASNTVSLDNDGDGLTDGADPDCVVNQAPVADPNGPYTGTVNMPVAFDGSGSTDTDGTIVSYAWTFGDGGTGTGATPSHTYTSGGTFNIGLTVTDNAGTTDTATTTATINQQPMPPIADANGPYTGVAGSPVSLDGSGSSDPDGTIVSYAWDFGDGGTGSGVAPTHTYSVDGSFSVTLTVTDNTGLEASDTTSATINPAGGNSPPTANANGPYTGTEGTAVQFLSTGSSDADGTITGYLWDFGDGSTSTSENPMHTFVAAAIYNVSLTVTDDAGDTGNDATTATIEALQVNVAPVADANGPYSGFVGDTIGFDGGGSADSDGTIVSYDWDFGDGSIGTGVAPTHSYASAGAYTVALTVTDDMGANDTATSSATIEDSPQMSDGEMQYNSYCAFCHGDPWSGPAVDPGLVGVHRVTGARSCSIYASIFGTSVFPGGAPGMEFLQDLVNSGAVDTNAIAEFLNSRTVPNEHRYVTACAGCHGDDGSGGRSDEKVTGESAADIRKYIEKERDMQFLSCVPDVDLLQMSLFLGGACDDDSDSDGSCDNEVDTDGDGVPNVIDNYPQGFSDVPIGAFAFDDIERLAISGITVGCGNGKYCPKDPVTRAQMAVFLERGMNGSDFVPPAATGMVFNDVLLSAFAASFIEQLAADGITSGCGNGNYCPDNQVTRSQMAVFLVRARYGADFIPPAATGVFNDVPPGSFAANFIEQLAQDGITSGCGAGNYCPDDVVTREQMAVFLVGTFEL